MIAGPHNAIKLKVHALEVIDYAIQLKDKQFLEEFSGSRLWRLIDDLLKWSWCSKNKFKLKNIFHVGSKEDKILSIKFRNELNDCLEKWTADIPRNPNGRESVFTEAFNK